MYYFYIINRFVKYAKKYECDVYLSRPGFDYFFNDNTKFSICIRKHEIKKRYLVDSNISKQMILKMNSKIWFVFYKIYNENECNKYNLKVFYYKHFPALKYYFLINKTDFDAVENVFYLNNDEN